MKKSKLAHSLLEAMLYSFSMLIVAACLFSCDTDKLGGVEHAGSLQLSLGADTTGVDNGNVVTKSPVFNWTPFLDTDQYKIEILQGNENSVVKTFDQYKDMPDVVELERGDYKIRASMGKQVAAAFDAPRFEGISDFIIKENMTTKLDVTCELVNARVLVFYTDSFKAVYPKYTVTFESSHTTEPFVFEQDESRSGWFQVNTDGEDLKGVLTATPDTGEVKKYTITIPSVKPKDNVRVTFNSTPNTRPDRGLTVKVTINNETIDVPVNIYVPDYMLPVKAVALESTGFANEDAISLAAGDNKDMAKVRIFAPGTIKYCWLTKKKDGTVVGEYDLATKDGAINAINANEGLTLPEILKKKDVTIDFTAMVNKLPRNAAGDKSVHIYDYILQVQDSLVNPHKSDPLTLRVKMVPDVAPKITVYGFTSGLEENIIEGGVSSDGSNTLQNYKATVETKSGISSCSLEVIGVDGNKQTYTGSTLQELATNAGIVFNGQTFDFSESVSKLETPEGKVSKASYVLNVNSLYEGTTYTATSNLNVAVAPPKFEMTMNGDAEWNGDAYAKRALLRAKVVRGKVDAITGFEYKDDSNTWVPVPENATFDADEEAVSILKGLTPEKSYAVRAVYGKHKSEEMTFTTEAIMQLPNVSEKGIDKWTSETYGSGGRTIWYPWDNNDETTKGWDTSNKESMQSGNGNVYESAASVMVKDGETLIRTVGWAAKTGISWIISHYLLKQTVGMLSFNSDNSNMTFTSRPLSLSFNYKYSLKNNRNSSFNVSIIVKDDEDKIITTKEYGMTSGTGICNVILDYPKSSRIAKSLEIYLKSDDAGGTLEKDDAKGSAFAAPGSEIIGSQLTISNLKLNYE